MVCGFVMVCVCGLPWVLIRFWFWVVWLGGGWFGLFWLVVLGLRFVAFVGLRGLIAWVWVDWWFGWFVVFLFLCCGFVIRNGLCIAWVV